MLRNSIRIETRRTNEEELTPGTSKFGGLPDLPPSLEWPSVEDTPLAFIAQISLTDVASYDIEGVLPTSGTLYFFYEVSGHNNLGAYPEDSESWHVSYYDGDLSMLAPTTPPSALDDRARFSACALEFSNEITLPQSESVYIDRLALSQRPGINWAEKLRTGQWTDEERERLRIGQSRIWEDESYGEVTDYLYDLYEMGDAPRHRLLGHPDQLQGDMQRECELVSKGLTWDDVNYREMTEATNWWLLLQVDSDENTGMMWGDVGRIYYWIKEEDLRSCNFDDVCMIVQF
jgi:uncharacterized protein YwqG